jgi:tRNA(adenine34) deaminase
MKSRVRASAVVEHQGLLLTFRAVDPTTKREYLFLPGGGIEPDETAPEAAARETFEETGFQIHVDPMSAVDREYLFFWNGEDYDCLTIFYRGYLASPLASLQAPEVDDADYNLGVVWLPVDQIPSAFAYSQEILAAVQELLSATT